MKPSELISFTRPLRSHQRECLDRFAYEQLMLLLWEMGTGKTTSAIAWLRAKYTSAKEVLPTLIVTPVATLYNWKEEFEINAPEKVTQEVQVPYMRTQKTKFTGKEKAKIIASKSHKIIVVNPESLDSEDVVKALKTFAPKIILIDEIHKFKNFRSKRLKALLPISDKTVFRSGLTGTMILNTLMDVWAPMRILDGGKTLGPNPFRFREQYFHNLNQSWAGQVGYFENWVSKPGSPQAIASLLSAVSSRLKKTDCLDLPPLIFETRHVEMSDEQRRAYGQMENEMLAELRDGTCAATNALSRVLRMLQILSGYVPVEITSAETPEVVPVRFTDNPRLSLLKELLEEITPENKVIVWCTFKENYKAIQKVLVELELPHAELTGDTKNRQQEIDRFQKDPACKVMVANPQAGGVGINLTAASYAIYYSRSYSLGDRLQSEARNHRGGSEQHKCITIIDLVCKGTLDEDVLAALLRKESFADNVIDRLRSKYK